MKKTKQNSSESRLNKAEDAISFLFGAIIVLTIASILIASSISHAYELGLKYGVGFGVPNATDTTEAKLVSFDLSNELGSLFRHKLSAGAWIDPHPEFNRSSATFSSYSIGLRVEPGYFYFEDYAGLALISETDSMLSTNFEFTEEVGMGVKDNEGRFFGLEYRHFSNAGIQDPNKGRDFVLINTGVHL